MPVLSIKYCDLLLELSLQPDLISHSTFLGLEVYELASSFKGDLQYTYEFCGLIKTFIEAIVVYVMDIIRLLVGALQWEGSRRHSSRWNSRSRQHEWIHQGS